jgi:galactokinase
MHLLSSDRDSVFHALAEIPPQFEVFAPGRVNLIGEHTDYNGGKVLPFAIGLGATVRATLVPRAKLQGAFACGEGPGFLVFSDVSSEVFWMPESSVRDHILRKGMLPQGGDEREILSAEVRNSWARYVVGAIVHFFEATQGRVHLDKEHLLVLSLTSSLPVGAGLSSSAALCAGVLSSLTYAFGTIMSAQEIAQTAMSVEHRFAGTKCGLMDQLAVMSSRLGHFTCIDFVDFPEKKKAAVKTIRAHAAFENYMAVAFHTGVSHSLANSEYNLRRSSCELALGFLNQVTGEKAHSLGDYADKVVFKRVFRKARDNADAQWLKGTLDGLFAQAGAGEKSHELAKRASHAILENARVDAAVLALDAGDLEGLDAAMLASHASLRDDYQVSCKELDVACETARSLAQNLGHAVGLKAPAILGPRMTGGGFGGSTVQLVHKDVVARFVEAFKHGTNPYTRETGSQPRLIVSQPQNGLRIQIL